MDKLCDEFRNKWKSLNVFETNVNERMKIARKQFCY